MYLLVQVVVECVNNHPKIVVVTKDVSSLFGCSEHEIVKTLAFDDKVTKWYVHSEL